MDDISGKNLYPISTRFDSEEVCMEALIAMKWRNGFVCPRCHFTRGTRLSSRRIPLFECGRCAYQASPLVGTIFEGTHLPLMKWFQALELFLLPDGISAVRLSQAIRVTYKTAWLMLHKIRHTLGECNARELLSGDVKVNSDQYGKNPTRYYHFPHPYATAVVAGCTVTESGEPEQVKIQLLPQKRGEGLRATRHELTAFINQHVDIHTSVVQSYPLAYRLYGPLWNVVREAWKSLRNTYVALGPKYLQAYLNEFTVRRGLRLSGATKIALHQKLLRMCASIPTISYPNLIAHRPNPPIAFAA
ncbi:transposase [Paenibacillus phocaensis]|uniref:transposase n=1 Tax=Paenibacillus phocaensis TaxID=1776378 RepID=UPI000839B312|nr:transposase [Paenibacillus phocaensis]